MSTSTTTAAVLLDAVLQDSDALKIQAEKLRDMKWSAEIGTQKATQIKLDNIQENIKQLSNTHQNTVADLQKNLSAMEKKIATKMANIDITLRHIQSTSSTITDATGNVHINTNTNPVGYGGTVTTNKTQPIVDYMNWASEYNEYQIPLHNDIDYKSEYAIAIYKTIKTNLLNSDPNMLKESNSKTLFEKVYTSAQWRCWRLDNNPMLTWHLLCHTGYYFNGGWGFQNEDVNFPDGGHTMQLSLDWVKKTFPTSIQDDVPHSLTYIPHAGLLKYDVTSDESEKNNIKSAIANSIINNPPKELSVITASMDKTGLAPILLRLTYNTRAVCIYFGINTIPVVLCGKFNDTANSVQTQSIQYTFNGNTGPQNLRAVLLNNYTIDGIRYTTHKSWCISHVLFNRKPDVTIIHDDASGGSTGASASGTGSVDGGSAGASAGGGSAGVSAGGSSVEASASGGTFGKDITVTFTEKRLDLYKDVFSKVIAYKDTSYTCILNVDDDKIYMDTQFNEIKFPITDIAFTGTTAADMTNFPYVKTETVKKTLSYTKNDIFYARPMKASKTKKTIYGKFSDMKQKDRDEGNKIDDIKFTLPQPPPV